MHGASYWIRAQWGARVETPSALAKRFLHMVDEITLLHPSFETWYWGDSQEIDETEGKGGVYPFVQVREKLIPAIERNAGSEDDGIPDPFFGYWMTVMTTDAASRDYKAALSVKASRGARGGSPYNTFANRAEFSLGADPEPSLVTYDLWRSIFLILNETWEATWAEASPDDIRPYWAGFPVRCAWMSYVSPRFAPLLTPPEAAIVEHRPNGGLFLAATPDVFEIANPAHVAVAREIAAALQPLNEIPDPNDAPYI